MVDDKYPNRWAKPEVAKVSIEREVPEAVKMEVKVIEKKLMKTVEKRKVVVGYKYFVVYNGSHLHLSITPGIGRVERGTAYQVPLELYNSLKGLEGWSVQIEEIFAQ